MGKTQLCRALAAVLFGSQDALIRFDMSEYMEPHSVSRLIGSPPGYVGHEDGGQLTEAVRRSPWSVVLLDELEKAHRDIWSILLQVMEEGVLTDSRGRKTDFRNTVLVMTSNLGSQRFVRGPGLGFSPGPEGDRTALEREVLADARKSFPPEFLNRLDAALVWTTLPWSPSPGSCWTRRGLAWRSWASLCLRRRVRWNCWPAVAGTGSTAPALCAARSPLWWRTPPQTWCCGVPWSPETRSRSPSPKARSQFAQFPRNERKYCTIFPFLSFSFVV